ncbi:tetratricopeptide repeat protein 41-like [Sinocyclocheilus rhinocerous]|uniref:tetratricopeptide repeat protein 41-like n=1 Tax=Sinocyclocheilus rhinocerous TaxID=307959 RepID=UPI0007B85893|nr:PREDICTED: tetratricopeptide repeat protein 41-like [Sinocyclocheilus rhinocerous]
MGETSDSLYPGFPFWPYLCYVPGDLQEELIYLKAKVFPHLDTLCQAKGTCFRPVDLQRSKQERTRRDDENNQRLDLFDQQLKISLDLIDRSSFFICLLGHSYGQCLPAENGSQSDIGPCSLSEVARNLHVAAEAGYPWVMEDEYRTSSLTELEITKAAFIDNNRSCFFYFKDCTPQDTEDDSSSEMCNFLNMLSTQSQSERQRMRDLKKRIINHCLPVRFFKNLHELEEMIKVDWEGVICTFHEDPKHPISGWQDSFDLHYHERHARTLCDWFVPSAPTTEILNALNKFLHPVTHNAKSEMHSRNPGAHFTCDLDQNDSEKSILLVCGERGCGKSTLAAWWLRSFCRQNPDVPVISHFCGTSTSSTDVRSMLRQCTAQLRRAHYSDFPDWDDSLEDVIEFMHLHRAVQAFTAAASLGPCILLVDGIDLLTETLALSKQEVKALRWLPDALPRYCKMIITTTFTDLTYKSLTGRTDVQILSCPHLSDPSVLGSILHKHLSLPYKELPASVLQRVARKKQCHIPAFLALIGTELRTCGVLREKEEEMELLKEYIEVDSIPELWVKVIHRWVQDYSRTAPTEDITSCKVTEAQTSTASLRDDLSGWVWDTLCLIHVSRAGLTEPQVLALLEDLGYCGNLRVQVLEWARLRSTFWPWVQEKANGLLTITHQSLSQAINLLLHGTDGQNSYQRILAKFFQKSNLELCSWARKMEEIPWHLKQTGSFNDLHDFLSDLATVEFLSSSLKRYPQMTIDVIHYWTLLRQRGFDPLTSFQNLMAKTWERLYDHSSLWSLSLYFSKVLLCLGEMQQAEELLLQADRIFQKGVELDSDSMSLLLKVQHMLAEFYIQMHLPKNTEMYCHKGLETARSLTVAHLDSTEVKLIVGQLHCRLCVALLEDGRLYAVPGLFKEISSARCISGHPCADGTAMLLKAIHKLSLCEPKTAEKCFQAALASRRRWYGHDHPLVAEVEEQLADLWARAQTNTEWTQRKMVELYRHVISTKETEAQKLQLPTMQHDLAVILMKLGKVLLRSCSRVERREGLDLLQRAADIRIHPMGPEHPLTRDLELVSNPDIVGQRKHVLEVIRTTSNNKLSLGRSTTAFKESHCGLQQPSSKSRITRATTKLPRSFSTQTASCCNQDETLKRPWTTFQVCVFGPQSDIRTLLQTGNAGWFDRRRSLTRSTGGLSQEDASCRRKL